MASQLAALEAKLGKDGIAAARSLVETTDREVLRYALKTAPRPATGGGFAGRVDRLLAQTTLEGGNLSRVRTSILNAEVS